MTGQIIRGRGGLYDVRTEDRSEYVLRARGRFRHDTLTPLVGDLVLFTPGEGEAHGWIDEILPRTTQSIRPPVANVEKQWLVIAPMPAPDLLLIDRLLVHARHIGFAAGLLVNKHDLDESLAPRMEREYAGADLPILPVSALRGDGLEALHAAMRGHLSCFAGQSGVGKTTLLNALLGLNLATGDVSRKIERGKHTTRHVELISHGDIRVLDTPGFSLLALERMAPESLQEEYPDFAPFLGKCRFQPCLHDQEPDCAVTAAALCGRIDPARLERYRLLLCEVRETWKARYH